MKSIKMFELGKEVEHKFLKIKGTLTHAYVNMDLKVQYIFQPKTLDSKGNPSRDFLCPKKVIAKGNLIDVKLPLEVLSTEVVDVLSGYIGYASMLIIHHNGCLHLHITSYKLEDGTIKDSIDRSILSVKGKKIDTKTIKELKIVKKPIGSSSPSYNSISIRDVV
jgi:hypothetical protein